MKSKFAPEPHQLDKHRRRSQLPLWKLRQILEQEYGYEISEGKLSRLLAAIDSMEPELGKMLQEILIGGDIQPAMKNNDSKGE